MKKDKDWFKAQIKDEEVDLKYAFDNYVPYEKVLIADDVNELLNQLEEPEQEKVIVPQFVADRIEEYREIRFGLSLVFTIDDQTEDDIDFSKWLSADSENCEKVARAWLDGYEVEKEKLYKVELPIDRLYYILTVHGDNSGHFFGKEHVNDSWYRTYLTEQEIKNIDERYWAFAEEITE